MMRFAISILLLTLLCTLPSQRMLEIVFVGDSIVQQMHGHESKAALHGVSGQTAQQIAQRIPRARMVILEGGTNDLFGLAAESGIVPAYVAMLEKLHGSRVILLGIPPIDEAQLRRTFGDNVGLLTSARIARLNEALSILCATYPNCRTAHAAMAMDMSGKTSDGIHFTAAGYAQLSAALASIPIP